MPLPFVQYGWRVYTNKVCSYKGLEATCPTLQHYKDFNRYDEFFWDHLATGQSLCAAWSFIINIIQLPYTTVLMFVQRE